MFDLRNDIKKNISEVLGCRESEIACVEKLKVGLTNSSYAFSVNGRRYVYRDPGAGTENFINRHCESFAENRAKELGLDPSFLHMDAEKGWKISSFIPGAKHLNPTDQTDVKRAMTLLRKLHDSGTVCPYEFDYAKEAEKILGILESKEVDTKELRRVHEKMLVLADRMDEEGREKCLTHNDFWCWNLLSGEDGSLTLIDWEYAGNSYPQADVAYFTCGMDCTDEDYENLITLYEGHAPEKKEKSFYYGILGIVFWYWYVWAILDETNGVPVDEKDIWYGRALHGLEKATELYGL